MIPKTIHYCWFGRGKKPHLIRKCIESWRRVMPDYEIKEWNEDNFDVNAIPFLREVYAEKKWAFVADYCRFYACYTEGGIYLDTDVEVFKRFDQFLNNSFFAGTEVQYTETGENVFVDSSVFGCEKGHWYAKESLAYYNGLKTVMSEHGLIAFGVVQLVSTNILKAKGYAQVNSLQKVEDVVIYPTSYFSNRTCLDKGRPEFSLHHYDGSWNSENRGKLYKFCRKHDLLHIYRNLERGLRIFKKN